MNNIIDWIKGFIAGKDTLGKKDMEILKAELEKGGTVSIDLTQLNGTGSKLQTFPNLGTSGCRYPLSCGMPTNWYGIHPPVCTKCSGLTLNSPVYCENVSTSTTLRNTFKDEE